MGTLDLALGVALLWSLILLPLGASALHGKLIDALLERAGDATYRTGNWRRALSCVRWARRLSPRSSDLVSRQILALESSAQRELGAPELALEGLMRGQTLHDMEPDRVNQVIDMLVSMGRYREALRVASPVLEQVRGHQNSDVASMPVLVDINLAEAEYNLGRWAEAEARLSRPEARCDEVAICHAGSRLQRAWVLAHRGRAEEALALCDEVCIDDLPGIYQAEAHYTRAAALIGQSRLDEAERAVSDGLSIAKRSSSERNGLFLLGRVAAARGRWAEAEAHCRGASAHRWRYQGGDGLLLWGEALARLGRTAEARASWALASERDAESESAAEACSRSRIAA